MAASKRDEQAYAEAIVNEQAAVARANAVFDQNLSDIATEKLDSVLMLLDVLIAARRIEIADANWILPAMGYSIDVPLGIDGEAVGGDDDE